MVDHENFAFADNIKSSYNDQKEQWKIEDMTSIIAKDDRNMKKERSKSISLVTISASERQKRKTPPTIASNENKLAYQE